MCLSGFKFYLSFVRVHRRHPIRMGSLYIFCMLLLSLMLAFVVGAVEKDSRRHIVLIIADDLGWNDVSLHGTDQVLTPNIDTLGYAGVTLGRYYSHSVCTPSRSALLTGKYAYTTGMQGYPLTNSEDRGLPITEKILPQYLKELGYATHLVGKWHVGSSREKYLATKRGFDSHFGHRGGYIDYYEYTLEEIWTIGKISGMGLFRNETAAWDAEGYITDLYNEEAISIIRSHEASKPLFLMLAHNAPHGSNEGAVLQAPAKDVRAMRHVESPQRRIFAAMMKKLDDSVGDVVDELAKKRILNNTIIIFISDNGGMTSGDSLNYASNYPLRGLKMSPFEGGIRVTGALWAPEEVTSHLYEGYMHVSDWLPTLLTAIGADPPHNIDGHNLWNEIISNKNSSRNEILEIDDMQGYASVTIGEFKLVSGNVVQAYSDYQGGDLKGIIGEAPSYIDAVKNSKAFQAFDDIGRPVIIDDIGVRNKLKTQCDVETEEDEVLCIPGNGKVCLYNIKKDPCERKDLSETHPDVVQTLIARLEVEKKRVIPRAVPLFRDPKSNPAGLNYTWDIFADND